MKIAKIHTKAGFVICQEGEYVRYVLVKEIRPAMGTPIQEGRWMIDLAWGRSHAKNAVIKDHWQERDLTGYGQSIIMLKNDPDVLGVSSGGYLVAANNGVCTITELKRHIAEVMRIMKEVDWT